MNLLLTLNLDLMLQALPVLFLVAVATWLISLAIDDVSIVDYIWSLLSLAAASTYAYHAGIDTNLSYVSLAMLVMVAIWALRLTYFLMKRGRNQPEDRRYQVIRKRNSPNFGLKSFYLIFIFQGLIAWIISSIFVPVFDAGSSAETAMSWTLWHSAGVALINPEGEWIATLNPPFHSHRTSEFLVQVIRHDNASQHARNE